MAGTPLPPKIDRGRARVAAEFVRCGMILNGKAVRIVMADSMDGVRSPLVPLGVEVRPDVSRQRTDAKIMCVEVLRAIGHMLHTGQAGHVTLLIPADTRTASVLGASLLRLASTIEDDGEPHSPASRGIRRDLGN